jgi:hypothetical protein
MIMLDKVCAYTCNYARDGIMHQYMIKFVIQITLKWNINKRTNYISACSKWFNIFFFVIYHLPIYVWTKSILYTFKLHDRGMGREISIVRHATKLWSINFLHMNYFVTNSFFGKFFCLRVVFKKNWMKVLLHICLLVTILQVPWNNVST